MRMLGYHDEVTWGTLRRLADRALCVRSDISLVRISMGMAAVIMSVSDTLLTIYKEVTGEMRDINNNKCILVAPGSSTCDGISGALRITATTSQRKIA